MERSLPDFIRENQATIHCLAMNAADALFSAAAMAKTDGPTDVAWWVLSQQAIEATAQLFACAPPPSEEVYIEAFEGENKRCQCAEVGGQLFLEWLDAAGNRTTLSNSQLAEAKVIKYAFTAEGIASCNWVTVEGEAKFSEYNIQDGSWPMWYIVPTLNTDCCSGSPVHIPVQPRPAPYIFEQYEARCGTEVTLIDSCIDKYGFAQNFYKVKEDYRECGGNDNLYYYWETIEGPYVWRYGGTRNFSYQVYCDPPYAWPHPHAAIPSGGYSDPGLSAVQYHLDVGCTYNPETDDFDTKYFYDVEATPDSLFGLSRRMDALAWMINNAQLIPYTSCAVEKPVLEGQWVTTRWQSDEKMDHSGRRLRKLFRYRTKSTRDLGQLSAYWKYFTWEAGHVIVWHEGAWWGTPKVWAKSAEEGQRVIRHAATEAGLDPDQVGRWKSSSSHSPRYGMSGNMRILKKDGYPWVASRDGENWPNVLARVPDS